MRQKHHHRPIAAIAERWPRSLPCLKGYNCLEVAREDISPCNVMQCYCMEKQYLSKGAWEGKRVSVKDTETADAVNSRWHNWGAWAASDMQGDQVQLLGCQDSQAAGSWAGLAACSAMRRRNAESAVVLPAFSVNIYYPRTLLCCLHEPFTELPFASQSWDFG